MNIELKPIAESKVRQMGGDVCGVLVRKGEKLATMVKVFRGCIETRVLPEQGSHCHKIIYDLVGAHEE